MNPAKQIQTVARNSVGFCKGRRSTSSGSTGLYHSSSRDFIGSFYAVLRRWESETAFSSNPLEITNHPSFAALVQNAELVVPLIIDQLRQKPSKLVWVLDDAFQEQPYSDDAIGDFQQMADAWITWAERNGRTL